MKKYLLLSLSNINENIKKYFLLVIVFALSFMSLLTALDFKPTVNDYVMQMLNQSTMDHQINLRSNDKAIPYFEYEDIVYAAENSSNIKAHTLIIGYNTVISGVKINMLGIEADKFSNLGIKVIGNSGLQFENSAYVSQAFAQKHNLKLNDQIIPEDMNGRELIVSGILENSTFMVQNGDPIILNLSYVQNISQNPERVSLIMIKTKNFEAIDAAFYDLSKVAGESVSVNKIFEPEDYTFYVDPINTALTVFTVFAILTTIILSYYVYKSIIISRVKKIATLKSVGLTKKELYISSLLEAVLLMIAVAFIGSTVCLPLKIILSNVFIGFTILSFNLFSTLLTFFILLIPICICSLIANKNILSRNVVQLIKGGELDNAKTKSFSLKKPLKNICSILLLMVAPIASLFIKNYYLAVVSLACCVLLSSIVSFYVIKFIYFIFKKIKKEKSFFLIQAEKQLNKNKGIILITTILIVLLSITSVVSNVLSTTMSNFYSNIDVIATSTNESLMEEKMFISEYNISESYKSYYSAQRINDLNVNIVGIDCNNYLFYSQDFFITDAGEIMLEKLQSNLNSIVISSTLANRINVDIGDNISLLTQTGYENFKIIGLVNSFEESGLNILVNIDDYNEIFSYEEVRYYLTFENASDIDKFISNFFEANKSLLNFGLYKISDVMLENSNSISKIISITGILVFVISLIAFINIIVNISLNITQRYKEFSISYTIGLSKSGIKKRILKDYLGIILISGILTVFLAGLLNYFIFEIINLTVGYFNYTYSVSILGIIGTFIIAVISIIYPLKKIDRINIVKNIKGEE